MGVAWWERGAGYHQRGNRVGAWLLWRYGCTCRRHAAAVWICVLQRLCRSLLSGLVNRAAGLPLGLAVPR